MPTNHNKAFQILNDKSRTKGENKPPRRKRRGINPKNSIKKLEHRMTLGSPTKSKRHDCTKIDSKIIKNTVVITINTHRQGI